LLARLKASSSQNTQHSWVFFLWLIGTLMACTWVHQWAHGRAQIESTNKAARQVSAFGLALENELEKYETLPFAMSLHIDVAQGLLNSKNPERLTVLNQYLSNVQKRAQITAAFVTDHTGLTIAASNWQATPTFVGERYGFRPYLQAALKGAVGRLFAVGTTSGEPGYFLAHPVYAPETKTHDAVGLPIGVVVIKIKLEEFERYWSSVDEPVALVDEKGVIFLSNLDSLKYRTLSPLSAEVLKEIHTARQYDDHELTPLFFDHRRQPQFSSYVEKSVGQIGWRLRFFVSPVAADELAWHSTIAVGLVSSIAGLIAFSVYQRRERARTELLARQALSEASETLEQRIASRTIDLVGANTELRRRYGQLKRAELLLRQTQNELIQAGKLGMLGQMAAGMTHELSQPLAAVQAFTDNAVAFIDLADTASARSNLEHINDACLRMSHIIRQLKSFARKSDDQVGAVDLAQAISNATLLVRSDYTQQGVTLHIQVKNEAQVMGDMVRVEQVIINLLRNALDAVKMCEEKTVHVELSASTHSAQIRIMDSGPGLPPQVRERLFEPFFTTKPAGQGLGLGLAISSSIVQAMEGELLAGNGILGGATFILKLPILNSSSQEKT
jgi:two-component system, NtrC family, C4-dicarboxylate transport sensor histidine kinase DctB